MPTEPCCRARFSRSRIRAALGPPSILNRALRDFRGLVVGKSLTVVAIVVENTLGPDNGRSFMPLAISGVFAPEMGKAATLVMPQPSAPAREPIAWMHAPSQPLMRSPLSRYQTPTAPRRNSRFFQVWSPFRSPCRADHSAYSDWQDLFRQSFQPSTRHKLNSCLIDVNAILGAKIKYL